MTRNTAAMCHELSGFLLCSFVLELCFALRCPETILGKELKQAGE